MSDEQLTYTHCLNKTGPLQYSGTTSHKLVDYQ